ncbi:EF-hand domain-containing protein [Nonomuraea rhizosphaerae]|uniref:EF-hand domain-containing protein n=1 Tax=Nonomuraea rhizosphaerae TaxID=2665663 RepID=UPI001C5F48B4|nr:hypothetical protein [Nonomuraea rhizosphaerae]
MDLRARNAGCAFDTSDMNHDGYLDHRDMLVVASALCDRLGLGDPSPPRERIKDAYEQAWHYACRAIGTETGCRISREAYVRYALSPRLDRTKFVAHVVWPITDALWDALDTDGDEKLDKAEYLRLWAAYDVDAHAAREAFERLRGRRAERVSKDEFAQAIYDFYYRGDAAAPILGHY